MDVFSSDTRRHFFCFAVPYIIAFHYASIRTSPSVQLGIRHMDSLMLNVFGELLKKELGSGLMSSRTREGNASNLFVVWQLESFLLLSLETIYFLLMLASFLRCFCSVPALELSRSAGCDLQTHRL